MIDDIVKNLVKLKQEFVHEYDGTSQIQEVIPLSKSNIFPINEDHLELLHLFATKNPIYYNSFEKKIGGTQCMVYEGDINKYWINSIRHGSSHAPFSPTWILSAYLATSMAKTLNFQEVIDVGSGDGRIAYCAKILDMNTHPIEIDDVLVDLQKLISSKTQFNFNPNCDDATKFDYDSLNLIRPAFFIGGLASMGGNILATGIIEKLNYTPNLKKNSGMVFVGTYAKKYLSEDMSEGGWGTIINKNNLKVIKTIFLPTIWTFKLPEDTPYIFTKFN